MIDGEIPFLLALTIGPEDVEVEFAMIVPQAKMEAKVVLISFAGSGLDLAGQGFVFPLDSNLGADGAAIDGTAITCQPNLDPVLLKSPQAAPIE